MSSVDQLAALQAKFKLDEEEAQKQKSGSTNTAWYPFWKMDFDETAIIRFLPDSDPENSHFVQEKWLHKLDVTLADGKEQKRFVPCLAMYGDKCPICAKSQEFYNDDDEKNGSRFWRKKSFIANIVVVESPFELDVEQVDGVDVPGSKVKLINMIPEIYDKIKKSIMLGDLDRMPTDYKAGYNFRLNKTKDGKWASFSTSSFAPRDSAVNIDDLEGADIPTLKSCLPKKPDLEYVEAVLHAALTGDTFEYKNKKSSDDKSIVAKSTKVDEAKVDEAKVDEAKVDEAKVDEAKVDEAPVATTDRERIMDIVARRRDTATKK